MKVVLIFVIIDLLLTDLMLKRVSICFQMSSFSSRNDWGWGVGKKANIISKLN